jgi:hypothetical protein
MAEAVVIQRPFFFCSDRNTIILQNYMPYSTIFSIFYSTLFPEFYAHFFQNFMPIFVAPRKWLYIINSD